MPACAGAGSKQPQWIFDQLKRGWNAYWIAQSMITVDLMGNAQVSSSKVYVRQCMLRAEVLSNFTGPERSPPCRIVIIAQRVGLLLSTVKSEEAFLSCAHLHAGADAGAGAAALVSCWPGPRVHFRGSQMLMMPFCTADSAQECNSRRGRHAKGTLSMTTVSQRIPRSQFAIGNSIAGFRSRVLTRCRLSSVLI